MSDALVLRDLTFSFPGQTPLFQNFALAIEAEKVTAIMGPSGSGKSTLLRLLAGLESPDATAMVERAPEAVVSFVFQDPTLIPWRTVSQNILLPVLLRGRTSDDDQNLSRLLELTGLYRARDLFPNQLSGGMRMRVSLARALVTRPQLLFLDEPFAALDEQQRTQLQDHLRAIFEETRVTAVWVTHAPNEAAFVADRVLVLNAHDGRASIADDLKITYPEPRRPALRFAEAFRNQVQRVSEPQWRRS